MSCLRRMIPLVTVGMILLWSVSPAGASVRGRQFFGGFVTNYGLPAICHLSFDTNGQMTIWENGFIFSGASAGPYTEAGLSGFKSWRAVVPDNSPNGTAALSGFCPLGLFTTYHNENLDQDITADGILFYIGPVP